MLLIDTAILFGSREVLANGVFSIIAHFAPFGMEVHSGTTEPKTNSKSEILFRSKPQLMYENPYNYDNADLSDVVVVGENRCMPIVNKFAYLDSVVTRECTDEKDVDVRVAKAANLCVWIPSQVFIFILAGVFESESESESEMVVIHLQTYCKHRISNDTLMERLSLKSIDTYISKQQLRSAGHVVRMPWSRLPRKMLSTFVRSKKPRGGAPQYTYGRSLYKALKKACILYIPIKGTK
jgi:hypothetical protein